MRIVTILMACMFLTACGVKPGHLAPPDDSTYKFPQPYPDPKEVVN